MPSPQQILQGLEMIAGRMAWLAVIWHIVLVIIPVAIAVGWRPSNRLFGAAISLPVLSVSIMAWIFGNPFNGAVFLVFFVLLTIFALRQNRGLITIASSWRLISGIILLIFGLVYPHFLDTNNFLPYLYKSPLGLVPCPTLSYIIGGALLFRGLNSKGWNITLIVAGFIYGVIGAFRLNVLIDLVLLAGSVLLILKVTLNGETDTRGSLPDIIRTGD